MSSTFFGLTIAGSGLNVMSAAVNTTANNISNVETDGYSRQEVNKQASSALRVFQKYGSTSTGVTATGVTQMRDEYYDLKFWNNESNFGYYDKKEYYMNQIEDYFNDQGKTVPGFSTIFGEMFNSLEGIQDAAGDSSARTAFISEAQKLVTYFNQTSARLQNIQSDINDEIRSTVNEINSIAQKIAILNKQINTIELETGHANDLRDQRALLLDKLSKIVNIDVSEEQVINSNHPDMYTGATTFKVKLNGQVLVDTYEYRELAAVTRDGKGSQSDITGLYDIYWKDTLEIKDGRIVKGTGNILNVLGNNQSGTLKAMFEMRDGNDGQNLHGRVQLVHNYGSSEINTGKIEIISPSQTEISQMNLPGSGFITANNVTLQYDSFEADLETFIPTTTDKLQLTLTDGSTKIVDALYDDSGNLIEDAYDLTTGEATRSGTTKYVNVLFDSEGKQVTVFDSKGHLISEPETTTYQKLVKITQSDGSVTEEPRDVIYDTNGNEITDAYDSEGNLRAGIKGKTKKVAVVYNEDATKADPKFDEKGYLVVGADYKEFAVLYDEKGDEIPYDQETWTPTQGGGTPKVEKYTLFLTTPMTTNSLAKISGYRAYIGDEIYTKGIPYYQNQMNIFLREFAKRFNDVHEQGQDLDGNGGEAFFIANSLTDSDVEFQFDAQRTNTNEMYGEPSTLAYQYTKIGSAVTGDDVSVDSYYQLTAASFDVNGNIIRNVTKMAATTNHNNGIDNNDLVKKLQNLESNVRMFRGVTADKFLQCIYADITVDCQESRVFSDNFENIHNQIDKQRQSVSGVDEDEEAMNLVKFQNAYNLNSKVISVLAEMYDQLILNTGV